MRFKKEHEVELPENYTATNEEWNDYASGSIKLDKANSRYIDNLEAKSNFFDLLCIKIYDEIEKVEIDLKQLNEISARWKQKAILQAFETNEGIKLKN